MGSCTNCGGPYWDSLLGDQGPRPDHPRGRLHPGLPAPARGPARRHRACCRPRSSTRTPPSAGRVSRLSSADSSATTEETPARAEAEEAVEVDEAREALVADLRTELGDALRRHPHRPRSRGLGPGEPRGLGRGRHLRPRRPGLPLLRLPLGHRLDALALRPGHEQPGGPDRPRRPREGRRRAGHRLRRRRHPLPAPGPGPRPQQGPRPDPEGRPRRRPRSAPRPPPGSRSTPGPPGTSARPGRCSASPSRAIPT